MEWKSFCETVEQLPDGQLWRHNQAGDLPGVNERINAGELQQLVKANKGKRGFTYTHKLPTIGRNAELVRAANQAGFTVNLSANNPKQADEYAELGIGPVVTVLAEDQTQNMLTPAGRKIVVCPFETRDNVTCASCGLCQRVNRTCIVGFPAHGTRKAMATAVARG